MISIETYKKWDPDNPNDNRLNILVAGNNPGQNEVFLANNGFDLHCEIENKDDYVLCLSEIILKKIGNHFRNRL